MPRADGIVELPAEALLLSLVDRAVFIKRLHQTAPAFYIPDKDTFLLVSHSYASTALASECLSVSRPHLRERFPSLSTEEWEKFYSSWLMYSDDCAHAAMRTRLAAAMHKIIANPSSAPQMEAIFSGTGSSKVFNLSRRIQSASIAYMAEAVGMSQKEFRRGFFLVLPALIKLQVRSNHESASDACEAVRSWLHFIRQIDCRTGGVRSGGAIDALIACGNWPYAAHLLLPVFDVIDAIVTICCWLLCRADKTTFRTRSVASSVAMEASRLWSPFQVCNRICRKSVQIGNVNIPHGSKVVVMIGAANRDPSAFSLPDEFCLGRPSRRNLAFGAGDHACVGVGLALKFIGNFFDYARFFFKKGIIFEERSFVENSTVGFSGISQVTGLWKPL